MRSGCFVTVIVLVLSFTSFAFDGGTGTADDPYQISTPQQLMSIGSDAVLLTQHYILTNDIVFDPDNNPQHVFTDALIAPDPDGNRNPTFTGSFNGNDYKIVNLKVVSTKGYTGMFSSLTGTDAQQVIVRDLTLINPMTSGGLFYCGALAGHMEGCKIESCHVVGGIVNDPNAALVGGLVGAMDYAIASNCSSSAQVIGSLNTGGFAGGIGASEIINCSATGNISSSSARTGGLVGWMWGGYDSTLISAQDRIINSFATGNIVSSSSECGGLVGYTRKGFFQNCYARGTVSGTSHVGGFIGFAESNQSGSSSMDWGDIDINACYAAGNVQGQSTYVGGLVGKCAAVLVKDCYAAGSVSSTGAYVGGLIGSNSSLVFNCYSTGLVTGSDPAYGLIGYNTGDVFFSYWDTQTSQKTTSAGGRGKITAQMKSLDTYRGWGDTIWVLNAGSNYPHLAWENTPGQPIIDTRPYAGAGTPENPYQIRTVEDLTSIGVFSQDWDKHFVLINSIILDPSDISNPDVYYTNANFNKIGLPVLPFSGHFNGDFYGIYNLSNQNINARYNGLFGYIQAGGPQNIVVENLRIINPVFAGRYAHGGLAGWLDSGKIIRCGVEGFTLLGSESAAMKDFSYFGGLIGGAKNATISMSYAQGISNLERRPFGWYQGGLVGFLENCNVQNSYAIVTFSSGNSQDGGFAGVAYNTTISHCYAIPTNSQTVYYIPGFIGDTDTSLGWCYYRYGNGISSGDGGGSYSDAGMKQQSNYFMWDFTNETANGTGDIWRMCENGIDYPRLNWQFMKSDLACPEGVSTEDLESFAARWLQADCALSNNDCGGTDFDKSGSVDLADFSRLAKNWLALEELQLYLKFDETSGTTAADSSIYNWPGTLTNGPIWSAGHTGGGGCLSFDGANDYVVITGYKGVTGTASRTCCAWIKTSVSNAGDIISWGTNSIGEKWLVTVGNGKTYVYIHTGNAIGTTRVDDGNWHHIAVVLEDDGSPNANEIKIYIDGVEDTISSSAPYPVNTGTTYDVKIGTWIGYYNGLIDDVRIYSRALTDVEITALAQ